MRNQILADDIGFATALLTEDSFQRRWAVFRDSEQLKFLRLFLEKRIVELQLLLENAKPEDLNTLQGQIKEAKKVSQFLAQTSIANEVASMKTWLGMK